MDSNISKNELLDFLNQVSNEGVAWSHCQGFEWLNVKFIPSLILAENMLKEETNLIADCYYVLGDIYDFNNAPLAAIKAYNKALELDENFAGAYRELANMFHRIGEYEKALEAILKSIELNPEDEYALDDKRYIEAAFNNQEVYSPLDEKSDLIWQCNELLAQNLPEAGLSLLKNNQSIEYRKAKARCCGALFDNQAYLKEWEEISKSNEEFELEYADWFYMPAHIYESVEIWKLLLNVCEKIRPSVFISYNSLYESEKFIKLNNVDSCRLIIRYNIFKNERNIDELLNLIYEYPEWTEVKDTIKALVENYRF